MEGNDKVLESDIFDASIESVKRLVSIIPKPLKAKPYDTVISSGRNHLRELFREKGKISLPAVALTVESIMPNSESYNTFALSQMGVVQGISTDNKIAYILRAKPVTVNLIVRFVSRDYKEALAFMKFWILHRRKFNFDITNEDGSFRIGIVCNPSTEVQIPEMQLDEGTMFEYETSIGIYTYIGEVHKINTFYSINTDITIARTEKDDLGVDKEVAVDKYNILIRDEDSIAAADL